jgi:hypothetical protein
MSQSPDPFEFLKTLWGPMGLPMAGMVAPTLNVSEIEKRIADLKSVENWLNLNLNVLRMTIQGLEMQKSTLAAMHDVMAQAGKPAGTDAGAPAGSQANPAESAAEAWRNALQKSAASGANDPTKK